MNRLATVFIAIAVVLAGVCIYLAREVGIARDAADAAFARARAMESAIPSVRTSGTATSATRAAFDAREPRAQAGSVPEPPIDLPPGEIEIANPTITLQSPAAKRVAVADARSRVKQFHADFIAIAQLDKADATALLDLIVAQELGSARGDFPHLEEAQAFYEAREREFLQQVEKLLGEDRAADFEAYRSTLLPRSEVDQLAGQLDALGMPLTEDQRLRMLRAVVQDRRQFQLPDAREDVDGEYFAAYADMEDGRSQRLAAHTRTILTGPQLRHFEDVLERDREFRAAESQLSR